MKHYTLFIYIISLIVSFPASAQIDVTWSPTPKQALGIVNESDGVVTRQFTARNSGPYSWQVLRGYTSCGCTQVKLQQDQTVMPGDSTYVWVSFDPKGKAGEFNEVVTVQLTDGEEVKNETLILTGEVRRSIESLQRQFPIPMGEDLRINTAKIDFGELKRGQTGERHLAICNTGKETKTLQMKFSTPHLSIKGDVETIAILPYETLDLALCWDGTRETHWGNTPETLVLTCSESREATTIHLMGMLLPAAPTDPSKGASLLTERRIDLGTLSPGTSAKRPLTITNTGNETLQVYRIYSDSPEVKVNSKFPIRVEPSKTMTFEVQIIPGNSKDFPITIISNDAKRPRQTVRMHQK